MNLCHEELNNSISITPPIQPTLLVFSVCVERHPPPHAHCLSHTGVETSPWDLSANNELHVIGSVSFATQQWLLTNLSDSTTTTPPSTVAATADARSSGDDSDLAPVQEDKWYVECGRTLLEEVARYWDVRMQYSSEKNAYEILG